MASRAELVGASDVRKLMSKAVFPLRLRVAWRGVAWREVYEGRSINQFQNGAILTVLKI